MCPSAVIIALFLGRCCTTTLTFPGEKVALGQVGLKGTHVLLAPSDAAQDALLPINPERNSGVWLRRGCGSLVPLEGPQRSARGGRVRRPVFPHHLEQCMCIYAPFTSIAVYVYRDTIPPHGPLWSALAPSSEGRARRWDP